MMCERPPRSLRSSLPLTRGRLAEGGRGSLTHHLELKLSSRRLRLPLRGVAAAHHRQNLPVCHLAGHEHSAIRTIFHGPVRNSDLVSCFERGSGPTAAGKKIGAHSLEAISLGAALVIGYIDPKPDVRIGPVELSNGTSHCLLARYIKSSKRVMCCSGKSSGRSQRSRKKC